MVVLNEKEVKIVRELIRNPRISDSKISKKTGVPVMTVNRKRRFFEENSLISYYADFCHGESGTKDFHSKQLYVIKFKSNITRDVYLKKMIQNKFDKKFQSQKIIESYLGEKDGRLALIVIVNAKNEAELVETFNGKIIQNLNNSLGEDCIIDITTTRITDLIRTHHNYLPLLNMEKGIIKKDWPDDWIFIDRKSYGLNDIGYKRISDF